MKDLERLPRFDRAEATPPSGEPQAPGQGYEGKLTRMRLVVVLCISTVSIFIAAPLCYGQCPSHVPSKCQQIANELNALELEKTSLQKDVAQAVGSQKQGGVGGLTGQITKLLPQIAAKQKQLNNCTKAWGKQDLSATFSGTATMTTSNPDAPGPFVQKISIGMTYLAWLHDQFAINNFPAIKVGPFDTPIGSNTTTVTLVNSGCGAADPKTGKLSVTLNLHFHESLKLAADSDLTITVSTENAGGSRLNSAGKITLVGDGTFNGGHLNADSCHLVVKGTLLPLP